MARNDCTRTHLVIECHSRDGHEHATDVEGGDGISQEEQRGADYHDPLGGIGNRVADRGDSRDHAEGNDVLAKVEEPIQWQDNQQPAQVLYLVGQVE